MQQRALIKQQTKLIKKNATLTECWMWPHPVEDFVRERVSGFTLNACAGSCNIGDIKLDLDPKQPGIVQANMRALPFHDETFDTVIQDPPWKIGYYQRWKPFLECVRVCKVGGRIIYNAYWLPWSRQVQLLETFIRQDERFANMSVMSVFERVTNFNDGWQPEGEEKQLSLELSADGSEYVNRPI